MHTKFIVQVVVIVVVVAAAAAAVAEEEEEAFDQALILGIDYNAAKVVVSDTYLNSATSIGCESKAYKFPRS
jgi:opacity protein-like surface antigen